MSRNQDRNSAHAVCVPAHIRAEGERKAEETLRSAGFIALSQSPMTWSEAKAFCQQQGGRLPRINNSDSGTWDWRSEVVIDGFGARSTPWQSSILPRNGYWTGTADSSRSGSSWIVSDSGAAVGILSYDQQRNPSHAACVPDPSAEQRTPRTQAAPAADKYDVGPKPVNWQSARQTRRRRPTP